MVGNIPDETNFDDLVIEQIHALCSLFAVTSCPQNMWNGTLTRMAAHCSLW